MLDSQEKKVSYIIGLDIGQNLVSQGIAITPEAFAAGIADAVAGAKPRLSQEEAQKVMEQFQEDMKKNSCSSGSCGSCSSGGCGSHESESNPDENMQRGKDFLAENSKKEGVITLPSGLQYKQIKSGSGKKPGLRDKVTTHYHGTLINGTVFDSSYERNDPATFPVNGVIAGWTEALQLMSEGSIWELYIPSDLAYGRRGAGGDIGPNETLIFKVELLQVH